MDGPVTASTATPSLPAPRPALDLRPGLLLAGFFALYTLNAWQRDFWAPEEPDFAAAAKEMSASGDWLVPRIAGQPFFEKPPLLYWLGLAARAATRLDPHAAYRLPVALFAVLGLWVAYLAGLKFFNARVGLAALLIQGTCLWFLENSSCYLTDTPFASAISLSVVAFGLALWREPKAARWKWIGFVGLAASCLAKSPLLGPYLIAAPLLLFLLFYRKNLSLLLDLQRLRPGLGLALVLLLVAPWYVWLFMKHGGDFFREAFFEQHFGRLAGAESHRQPGWYYLLQLPAGFLPWSLFLPLILFYSQAHFRRTEVKLLVLWMVVTFVTLSLISSKQGKYLLPMLTPLALLTAAALLETRPESIWEGYLAQAAWRVFPWAFKALAALLLAAGALQIAGLAPAALSWFDLRLEE
ncbi:MAG: glycosyltransferase family 39 protein, partial [Planctomycetes bacterium]|nr:glycosyltransferase family 39 protein [Planctomycetota bacterium]